jgi:hypothetical protein
MQYVLAFERLVPLYCDARAAEDKYAKTITA